MALSHIEQIAARLNWPCLRITDGHISRFDLLGKDSIILKDNNQLQFKEGLTMGYSKSRCFSFNEYDAGRPDLMFVIQRF